MKKFVFCFLLLTIFSLSASVITKIDNKSDYIVQITTTQHQQDIPTTIRPRTKIIIDTPCQIPYSNVFNDIETDAANYLECNLFLDAKAFNKKMPHASFLITEGNLKSYAFNNQPLGAIWLQKRRLCNSEDDETIQHIGTCQEGELHPFSYTLIIDEFATLGLTPNNE